MYGKTNNLLTGLALEQGEGQKGEVRLLLLIFDLFFTDLTTEIEREVETATVA